MILTTDRDEFVYADIERTLVDGSEWEKYQLQPSTKRGEWRFLNMHNMTEKDIRQEIRWRLGHGVTPTPKIRIYSIYLKED